MLASTHVFPAPSAAAAKPLRMLGIDPGLQRTGYAIVELSAGDWRLREAGTIRLGRSSPLPSRLLELERSLTELIETQAPAALACEELYAHYKHPRTAILMGHARGVILALAARNGLQIQSISATQAKKLLTGSGHARKPQMQRAVASLLGLRALPEPHDVADAIAIALAGVRVTQAKNALAEASA